MVYNVVGPFALVADSLGRAGFIAQGQLDEADAVLGRLLGPAQSFGRTWRVIEILMLQALAFQAGGDSDQAMTTLEGALTLAQAGGFIRIFVDEGPPMASLLYEALAKGISPDYIRQLLAAFPDITPEQTQNLQTTETEWIEPLSERELEVLQLIAEGLPNKEIAAKLYLSLNTVKAHTRTIYSKLDVNSRIQAAAKARALGLIASD